MPVSLQTADQFLSFAISLGSMRATKKPFMSEPSVLFYLRVAYVVSVLLQVAAALFIRRRIAAQSNRTTFKMKPEVSFFGEADTNTEEVEVCVRDYDMDEINKLLRACVLQFTIVSLVHWKWGVIQPLLIQSTTFLRNVCFNPLYYAYLYGVPMERPFEKNMLFGAKKAAPKAATEEASAKKKKED